MTFQGVPDQDPPEGLSPAGRKLWHAMREFYKTGDITAFDPLLTHKVTFTEDGEAITEIKPKPPAESEARRT